MPFSLFAARCMYVARQPLQYRRDVIRRIYNARVASHVGLFTFVKGPEVVGSLSALVL